MSRTIRRVVTRALLIVVTVCCALPIRPCAASSVGINFVGGQHSGGPDASELLPDEVAGVIAQPHWNNVGRWSDTMNVSNGDPRADGMSSQLVDDTGILVPGLSIQWEADNSYAALNPAIDNPDEKLMDGYIDVSTLDREINISFAGIPYEFYDVYVYVGTDGLFTRRAVVQANADPDTDTYFIGNTGFGRFFSGPGDYEQATATTADDAFPSNYVFYQSLVGSDLDLKLEGVVSNAGIHGLQIVESFDVTLRIDRGTGQAEFRNDSQFDIDMGPLRNSQRKWFSRPGRFSQPGGSGL